MKRTCDLTQEKLQKSKMELELLKNKLQGKRKPCKGPSIAWEHFTRSEDKLHATCNYCNQVYACDTKKIDTSNLLTHLSNLCTKYPYRVQKKQKTLQFQPKKGGEEGSGALVATSYNHKHVGM